jgi:hypothetical protein
MVDPIQREAFVELFPEFQGTSEGTYLIALGWVSSVTSDFKSHRLNSQQQQTVYYCLIGHFLELKRRSEAGELDSVLKDKSLESEIQFKPVEYDALKTSLPLTFYGRMVLDIINLNYVGGLQVGRV